MNPETGTFHEDDGTLPEAWPRFEVGEKIAIKDHEFEIESIDTQRHTITLALAKPHIIHKLRARMRDEGAELPAEELLAAEIAKRQQDLADELAKQKW